MSEHNPDRAALLLGGPTASGKSALALDLAERLDGVVINADSMQLYRELPILTAQPGPADQARAPHRLYGVLPAAEPASAARWRSLALAEIERAEAAALRPILVGGTGLYLKALVEGLADIPAVPPAIRREAAERHRRLGGEAFRRALAALDPVLAERLPAGDTQRLIRAWEVAAATGRPLSDWQREPAAPPPRAFDMVVLLPPRDALYAACDRRFLAMLAAGALDEVRALDRLGLDPALPAMKALGVPELRAHVRGELGRDEAVAAAQQATRRYAKRQLTWFRRQPQRSPLRRLHTAHEQYSESLARQIVSIMGRES